MQVELNIGLNVAAVDNPAPVDNPAARTEQAARAMRLLAQWLAFSRIRGRIVTSVYEHEGAQVAEPTLIVQAAVHGREPQVYAAIVDVAVRLRQDCIAVLWVEDDGTTDGELVGPRAHEWGVFDRGSFTRYDEAVEERAA